MTTTVKTCFVCGAEKPLTDFYKHKMMRDGRLNKCKECTKSYVRQHRAENDSVREYDRRRYRENPKRQQQVKNWLAKRTPEQRRVHYMVGNAIRDGRLHRPKGCWHCGKECRPEAHHAYYDINAALDVTWLCRSCHCKVHAQ